MTGDRHSIGAPALPGLAVLGAFVTGVCGLLVAVVAVVSGDFVGAGVGLVASALAFGLLANAVFRR
jgi:hypothetical protein